MVKIKNKRIEPFILSVQQITRLQIDLKEKNLRSFEQLIVVPTRELLLAKISSKYPELRTQTNEIIADVYRKMKKHILRTEIDQKGYEAMRIAWRLTQEECSLSLPTTENRKKNLGLSKLEFNTYCQQLRQGDETLIEKVYLAHFKKCMSYLVYNDKASEENAHAATIEALIEIRKDLLAGKIMYGNLGFYFTNRAKYKLYKERGKKKESNLSIDELEFESEENTEKEMIQNEISILVNEAINKLCGECREIIRQYYYEEKTLKEIGEKMNKSHSAVRKQTTRCRDKLRKALGEKFYDQFSMYLNK